ncbi:MAG: helix-turn-helix domain-containing protein [Panacagrimonas sp.]
MTEHAELPYDGTTTLVDLGSQPLIEPLTRRELEVLQLICDGASNLEIAEALSVSIPTVKYHVFQIFQKLSVERRTQAVAIAVHLKIVLPGWMPRASSKGELHPWKPLGWKVFQTPLRLR